ncbi:MAG: P-loop NTPase fold protein [Campylobacterales bacterium]|nr:P-loop NTPase fold protein [Campylobacterales bacterium]
MHNNDLPKKSKEEDSLNFAPYASRVAKGILNYSQDETFILSIEGEWGSGKTTLINFIKNEIKGSEKKDKYRIIHFNPWLITDINQVVKLFFDELMKIILSVTTKAKKDEFKKDVKKFIAAIAPDSVSIGITDAIKAKYNIAKRFQDEDKDNLEKIKERINEYLKGLEKKIVIIIDDIDRLTDKETEFIFRLTKGIADFDNLIYILLYDKGVVSKSLEKFKSEKGQKYLEKIVQYPLTIPKPHKTTIKRLLFKELDEILEKLETEKVKYIFNKETWSQVHLVIDKYIKTVRDINQIVNIVSFEYPIIAEDVNFTDFFIISLIKLKNHTLHELIQDKPSDFFIGNYRTSEVIEKEKKRIIENFNENLKDFFEFKDLLEIIFPIYSKYDFGRKGSHTTKYISNINYFENYFSFSTSDDKMSMKEYYIIREKLLSLDFEAFKEALQEVDKKQKSQYFLDMFYELKESIEKEGIENAFYNTLKVCKLLKSENVGSYFGASVSYEHLGYSLLLEHKSVDNFLLDFYKNDDEISFIIKAQLLKDINEEIVKEYSDKKVIISKATLEELNNVVREKLEDITLNKILEGLHPSYIVYIYDSFKASLEKLSNELKDYIFKDTKSFFEILKVFERVSKVMSSNTGQYDKHSIAKDNLLNLIDLNEVEEYIKNLNISTLSDEQNILLTYWKNNEKW